jgi:quinoprotein glucose dehydrogenase
MRPRFVPFSIVAPLLLGLASPGFAQTGAAKGEWHYYGGDAGNTKYAPLDQINAANVKDLTIAWRWKSDNFGPTTDTNLETTPLMVGGTLYFTAGTRRAVIAADAATGETLWMYRLDEGARGASVARRLSRGVAYWTDGKGDDRVILITPGFQLVALDAKTGRPIPKFGKDGIVDLTEGLDRDVVLPGQIGSSSPAIVIRDVIVTGSAHQAGTAPPSKTNVPGYIRGFDVRTGKKIWTFKTIPQAGEPGNETWENDSWKYTGNTGAWAPLAGDEELGHVYIPVEAPTGDFYGGHRLGDNLYSGCLVALDAKTGKKVWHYQVIHHDIWDYEPSSPPLLMDITVGGKKIKAVGLVMKHAFTFVFDRVTGKPVWPIEERPVPQSKVPGERASPTQPFPTKPLAFDRQGITKDDLIDFTPELRAEAEKIFEQYVPTSLFTPPMRREDLPEGKIGTLMLPHHTGGANWPGASFDPETGLFYVSSLTNPENLMVSPGNPDRTDMTYVGGGGGGRGVAPARGGAAAPARGAGAPGARGGGGGLAGGRGGGRGSIGPQGLPLVKGPWGRITAIDMNTGDHAWMTHNGDAPDSVKNHPALKGIDLSKVGRPERTNLLVTKTLLFSSDGAGLFNTGPGGGGPKFRALDKKTGAIIHEMELPANVSGSPMTYLLDGRQYIVVAVSARGVAPELVALALP